MIISLLLIYPEQKYTVKSVLDVARFHNKVKISGETKQLVEKSHQVLMKAQAEGHEVYGCNTPYGARVNEGAPLIRDDARKQMNLALMLNCSSGPLLPEEWVRAAILVRLFSLSQGCSGVRPVILDELCRMLNENDIPKIPEVGSIGASGDLSPLSYIALHLEKRLPLENREVLALSNGTSVMAGVLASVIKDLLYLNEFAYILFGILFQCLEGVGEVFDEKLHALKKHGTQQEVSKFFRELLAGSELLHTVKSRAKEEKPIQDPYSFRCLAQQIGPDLFSAKEAQAITERELQSVADNPVILCDDVVAPIAHGGHFDGRWIALASYLANFSIQGTAQLTNAYIHRVSNSKLNEGLLPNYLVANNDGFNNGLQGLNITSSACHTEIIKNLLPMIMLTHNDYENANQDVVSMGTHAAVATGKATDALRSNLARLAIFARQAIGIRGIGNKLSPATGVFYNVLCQHIPFVEKDRSLHDDLRRLEEALKQHAFELHICSF